MIDLPKWGQSDRVFVITRAIAKRIGRLDNIPNALASATTATLSAMSPVLAVDSLNNVYIDPTRTIWGIGGF